MIGIIGGNGVAATNKLCSLIEENLTLKGAFRDAHHPEMLVWHATQAPSRSMYLEGLGESWIESYIDIGLKLKSCGCSDICMCCNTAHYAIDILEDAVQLPFINLLELVAKKCNNLGVSSVGMMCTNGLRKIGLYDQVFSRVAPDIKLYYPDEKMQAVVTEGICNAKNATRYADKVNEPSHPYNCFSNVCEHLRNEKHVECIVAGCTDICNVFEPSDQHPYVDSLVVLADYIIENFSPNPNRVNS